MFGEYVDVVRKKGVLIHNITNYVTVNDVANIILACGASPIMADEVEEVEEITSICAGLNLNIGTLQKRTITSMLFAGKKAKELGHVVLLDPVGAGASSLRTSVALEIIEKIKPDVIRGNMSEIKTLAYGLKNTKGVDADIADKVSDENLEDAITFVKSFAKEKNCVIAVTGAIDLVSDGNRCFVIRNGRSEMASITGTGCQLSGMMCAYISSSPEHILEAAAASVCAMGLAGEIAWRYLQKYEGNATYRNRIIDAVNHMDAKTLEEGAKYEIR